MRASTKTLRERKNESASAMNFYAASFGKGPTFDLEPETVSRPRAKPHPGPEAGVLAAVLKLLVVHPAVAWVRRMNTGSFQIGSGPSARWFRAGFKGCSDILGQMRDGRLIAIECKAERGRVSLEQQAFLDTVRQYGGVSGVARGVTDAELIIKYAGMRGMGTATESSNYDQSGQGTGRARAVPDQPAHAPTHSPVAHEVTACTVKRG